MSSVSQIVMIRIKSKHAGMEGNAWMTDDGLWMLEFDDGDNVCVDDLLDVEPTQSANTCTREEWLS